jgi:uncharacterized protein DUF6492
MKPANAVFITPTFARDYERFSLQRESIERCGIDIPHLAIVNHEDLPRFADLPFRRNLTLISTADALPASFERRRKLWGTRRRSNPRHWFIGRGIHGWMIQQLIKLAAPSYTDAETIICLDSDLFFVDRVTAGDFAAADGRLHLYETEDDLDAQMAEWYAHALRFLGLPTMGQPPRRFTHAPVPWRRDVLADLHRFIERRHGRFWMDAVADADRLAEYTLYGTYARHIDELKRATPVRPDLTLYYWWPDEARTFEADFHARLAAGNARAVLVNSNLERPAASYRALAERAWAAINRKKDSGLRTQEDKNEYSPLGPES